MEYLSDELLIKKNVIFYRYDSPSRGPNAPRARAEEGCAVGRPVLRGWGTPLPPPRGTGDGALESHGKCGDQKVKFMVNMG